jgi:type I restriction enzyme R subunit
MVDKTQPGMPIRGQRFGDPLHQRVRPQSQSPAGLRFPAAGHLGPDLRDAAADPEHPTWRGKVTAMPELDIKMLRPAQITAISGIERSLAEQRFDPSLVQMATGAGKTFAALTTAHRLLKRPR